MHSNSDFTHCSLKDVLLNWHILEHIFKTGKVKELQKVAIKRNSQET